MLARLFKLGHSNRTHKRVNKGAPSSFAVPLMRYPWCVSFLVQKNSQINRTSAQDQVPCLASLDFAPVHFSTCHFPLSSQRKSLPDSIGCCPIIHLSLSHRYRRPMVPSFSSMVGTLALWKRISFPCTSLKVQKSTPIAWNSHLFPRSSRPLIPPSLDHLDSLVIHAFLQTQPLWNYRCTPNVTFDLTFSFHFLRYAHKGNQVQSWTILFPPWCVIWAANSNTEILYFSMLSLHSHIHSSSLFSKTTFPRILGKYALSSFSAPTMPGKEFTFSSIAISFGTCRVKMTLGAIIVVQPHMAQPRVDTCPPNTARIEMRLFTAISFLFLFFVCGIKKKMSMTLSRLSFPGRR